MRSRRTVDSGRTTDQNSVLQIRELNEYAINHEWEMRDGALDVSSVRRLALIVHPIFYTVHPSSAII